jgi:hypothetical protein
VGLTVAGGEIRFNKRGQHKISVAYWISGIFAASSRIAMAFPPTLSLN